MSLGSDPSKLPRMRILPALLLLSAAPAFAQISPIAPRPLPGITIQSPVCSGAPTLDVAPGAALPSVAAALTEAQRLNACSVTVRIAAGTYSDPLTVSRPTTLVGASRLSTVLTGGIVDRTVSGLTLRTLTLRDTPGVAVLVETASATTTLEQVTVLRAHGYGVKQQGGTLVMRSSVVFETVAGAADRTEGAGVLIQGGAHADLQDVLLATNASNALVARGPGTHVVARRTNTLVTGNNPNFPPTPPDVTTTAERSGDPRFPFQLRTTGGLRGFGAVSVSEGATFLGEDMRVERSKLFGIVAVAGAHVHLRRVVVLRTEAVALDRYHSVGGFDVVSVEDSVVEVHDFDVGASGVGLAVDRAWLTLQTGRVHDNTMVGVVTRSPRDSGRGCHHDVAFERNGVPYDAGGDIYHVATPTLDVSSLVSTDDSPPPPPPPAECASVPWE